MPVNLATLRLRPERPEDEAFLREVFDSTRREEFAAAGVPSTLLPNFLAQQFQAQRQGYRTSFPEAEFLVIEVAGQSAGRIVIDRNAGLVTLVDIALLPSHRRQGIGTKIIRRLSSEAAASGQAVQLSVIRGQPAARLYERLGFIKVGETGLHDVLEWRR